MKKLLTLLLVTAFAWGADNAKSIIAVEYGYLGTTTKTSTVGTTATADNGTLNTIGLKLGAAEDEYRLFLSYRLLQANNGTTTATLGQSGGAELDYVINLADVFGLYFGVVGGYAGYTYTGTDSATRDLSSFYAGGNAGAVLTFGQFEIDAGVRYWYYLNGQDVAISSPSYLVQDTTTYYAAVHFFY